MTSSDHTKFFEFGEVILAENDFKSRQSAISITIPCCLFQAVTPSLLGGGMVDNLKVREPVAVWLPKLSSERISPLVRSQVPDAEVRINTVMKAQVDELLKLFQGATGLVVDPADLVPYLPLGVYVCFRFRCQIDNIPKILEGINSTLITGVPEFQWALAMVLQCALEDHERYAAGVTR